MPLRVKHFNLFRSEIDIFAVTRFRESHIEAFFQLKKGLNVHFKVTRDGKKMSISLRKEQGFYFMQRTGLKTPISALKRFECSFQGNA